MISNKIDRLIYTIFILLVFKFLCFTPLPFINSEMLDGSFQHKGIMAALNMLTGGSIQKLSILALGLSPSVMVQMLIKIIKNSDISFKEYDKDPLKRRQITRISRWLTIVISLAYGVQMVFGSFPYQPNLLVYANFWSKALMVMYLTCGAVLTMWLTERINDRGIGNGFGAILLTSVLSSNASSFYYYIKTISILKNYQSLLQALMVIGFFNLTLFASLYLLFFNKKRLYYIIFVSFIPVVIFISANLRDNVLSNLKPSMIILVVVCCIFSLFASIILYGEDIIYKNKICMYRREYTQETSEDVLPMKINPGGIAPVIFGENSVAIIEVVFNTLVYTGIFSFFEIKIHPLFPTVIRIIWKSLVMFIASFLWTEIEVDPKETANKMKSKAFFNGVAEGLYTQHFVERFTWLLSITGAVYLLIVVTLPDIINTIFHEKQIFTGAVFNGTVIILIVSCSRELCDRLILSTTPVKFKAFS